MAPEGLLGSSCLSGPTLRGAESGFTQLFLWGRNLRFRCTLLGKNEKLPKVTDVPLRTETSFASVSGVSLVGVTPFLLAFGVSLSALLSAQAEPEKQGESIAKDKRGS